MTINQNAPSSTIEAWQAFLNGQGIPVGTADGIWGPHTENASKTFQRENNLTVDGIVGQGTISAAESKGFKIPAVEQFCPTGNLNAVFDISHLNPNVDLARAKSAGMLAVFHKATQSGGATIFHDPKYADRRKAAQEAGLLWGAYHFGTGGNGADQADEFLAYAQPDNETLLVLDFERCTTSGETTMTLAEAKDFIQQIKAKTGKYPGIYGGSLLKSMTSAGPDPVLSKCWLWIAQYESAPKLPAGWTDYTFWQFTDGTHGPGALPIDGVGTCDRDLFKGTAKELVAFWTGNSGH